MNRAIGADLSRLRIIGPKLERPIEVLERLVAASQPGQGVSDVEVDLRRVGMRCEIRLVRVDRLLHPAQHLQIESLQEERVRVVVPYRLDQAQELQRPAVLAGAVRGERRLVVQLQRPLGRGRAPARLVLAELEIPSRRGMLGTPSKDLGELVDGLLAIPHRDPGVRQVEARLDVETAQQMADAVDGALPADVAILVAAVADWKVDAAASKLKKSDGPPVLSFTPNPDILQILGSHPDRPGLLIGFAAETNDVVANAEAKLRSKKADWIVANDVSGDVMGGHRNRIHLVTKDGVEDWPEADKEDVARHLVERIAQELK